MTKLTVSQIIAALPFLSPDNLNAVVQAASSLTQSKQATPAPATPANLVFTALTAELSTMGLRHHISYESCCKQTGFKRSVVEIDSFLNDSFSNTLKSRNDKIGLLRMLISSLITIMRKQNIPITLNTVASNLHRLPTVFDDAFPGYLENGMGHLVVAAMKRRTE